MSSYLSTHVFMTGNLGSGVQKQLGFLATNLSNSVSRLTKNSIFKILDEFCPFFVIITQEKKWTVVQNLSVLFRLMLDLNLTASLSIFCS